MLAGFLCFFKCALFGTRTNQSTIQFSCVGSRTRCLSVLPSCRGRLWVCQWSLTLLCMPGSALWHYCCRYGCQWEKRECQAVRHFTTVKAKGAEYDTCEYRESVTAAHSVGFLYCMYIHILDVLTEECTRTETGGEGGRMYEKQTACTEWNARWAVQRRLMIVEIRINESSVRRLHKQKHVYAQVWTSL